MEYPPYLICPNCKNKLKINYENYKYIARTNDILKITIAIPQSYDSAKDARKNKQDQPPYGSGFCFCRHCKVILGTTSGTIIASK